MNTNSVSCKICGSTDLKIFAHTARCGTCHVLLFFPYPPDDQKLIESGSGKCWHNSSTLNWYLRSAFYNHDNFTHMIRFATDASYQGRNIDVLDFGGGGGQFALVFKSHFPRATVHITDISDDSLLNEWKPLNNQIKHRDFDASPQQFDLIFLNDVFEHVSHPVEVLRQLNRKLKPGGKIFIDTPKQFWIYPVARLFSGSLYRKILKGTVSEAHLQIWSKKSFLFTVAQSGLHIDKYQECSEFTMPADHYMKNMGISNPVLLFLGRWFYRLARFIAKNKIMCVVSSSGTVPVETVI